MSDHHLKSRVLSLKAKGLLSLMLSLRDDWGFTLKSLSHITLESIDAIRTAVWELEKTGYIVRQQGRDAKGKMTAIEYTIYEQPRSWPEPALDSPILENPTPDNPTADNPTSEEPTRENIHQRIAYNLLLHDSAIDKSRLDEIVDIMLETLCATNDTMRIAGNEYLTVQVQEQFYKINSLHIQYVFHCLSQNTRKV